MLRRLTFALAGIEAAILLGLVLYLLNAPGATGNGGREMALFFFVLLPGLLLAFATALLRFGRASKLASGVATTIIAAPVFGLAHWGLREVQISLGGAELQSGRGYFEGSDARALGEAVVSRDLPAVARLAGMTDVNRPGSSGTTFLKLALDRRDFDIRIVRALLAAGANPNDDRAWSVGIAIYYGSAPLLEALLAAGGDPNTPDVLDTPMFFRAVRRPELIPQLLAGGARIEATDGVGRTMLLDAINDEGWAAAEVLLAQGANPAAIDRDGKGAAELLDAARQRIRDNSRTIEPGLPVLAAKLGGAGARPDGPRLGAPVARATDAESP